MLIPCITKQIPVGKGKGNSSGILQPPSILQEKKAGSTVVL